MADKVTTVPDEIAQEIVIEAPSTAGMTARVAKGSFWGMLAQVIPLAVSVFSVPVMIRYLGSEAYGILVLTNLIPAYFAFTDFGMAAASTKFASAEYAVGDSVKEAQVIRTSALLALILSLPATIFIFVFSQQITLWLNIDEHIRSQTSIALKIAAFCLLFTVLSNIVNTPQLTRLRLDLNLLVTSGFKVLGTLSAVILLYFGFGVTGAVFAVTGAMGLVVLGHIIVSGSLLPQLYGVSLSRDSIKPLLRFGGAMVAAMVAAMLLINLEKLVLTRIVSVKALAYYSIGFLLSNTAAMFTASMAQALLPAFSQLLRPEKKDELNLLFFRFLRLNLIALFPAIVGFFIIAKTFFTLWAGPDFGQESTLPFYILLGGLFFNLLGYLPNSILIAAGRTGVVATIYWIEVIPYTALVMLLTSQFGIAGAAVAWSARVTVDAFVMIYFAHKLLGLGLSFRGAFSPMVLLALLLGSVPVASVFLFDNILITLPIGIAFVAAYIPIVWNAFLTQEEKDWAGGSIRRLLVRNPV